MSRPKFSILIPTRDRPVTLRHTLATVLAQSGNDYEIIVADNCGSPAVPSVIEDAASDKIKYYRTDEILPMTRNWEIGLSRCTGDYVTILGDDDGLMPHTLDIARPLLAGTGAKVLTWEPHTYWWPDTIVYWNSNRLILNLADGRTVWCTSQSMLKAFYDGAIGFNRLPMIYSSFVHRDCIQEIVAKYGSYFILPHIPDVVSGVINLCHSDQVLMCGRPLSIRGNSGKSNGTAQWARSLGVQQREAFFREEKATVDDIIHPSLIPSPNLSILIASVQIQCKERFFPDDRSLNVNLVGVIHGIIQNLNSDPDAYDDTLSEALALAAKHGIVIDRRQIPEKTVAVRKKLSGPVRDENGQITKWVVNCDQAGVENIYGASRLAKALSVYNPD